MYSRDCWWHNRTSSRQPRSLYICGCTRASGSTGIDWYGLGNAVHNERIPSVVYVEDAVHAIIFCMRVPNAVPPILQMQVSGEDLNKYNTLAQQQAKKLFPTLNMSKFYAAENADPLVFCHFAENIQDQIYDQVKRG